MTLRWLYANPLIRSSDRRDDSQLSRIILVLTVLAVLPVNAQDVDPDSSSAEQAQSSPDADSREPPEFQPELAGQEPDPVEAIEPRIERPGGPEAPGVMYEEVTREDDEREREDEEAWLLDWETPDDPLAQREAAYREFKAHFDAQQYQEAAQPAQEVVELTEQTFGPDHPELVTPLNNLATVQERVGDYEGSEASYRRSIAIVEKADGYYSDRLVRPLMGLGVTFNAAGRYQQGLLAFQRAQHITHRREGVYNLDQIELIDGETQSYLGLNEFSEADRSQRLAFIISERKLGKDNIDLVPAMQKLAQWYQRTFQYANERIMYERALEILEAHHGANDLALIEPLRGIATSRNLEGLRRSEGEQALERRLEIVRASPEATPTQHLSALVELGDWYMASNKPDQGIELYKEAWDYIQGNNELSFELSDIFDNPVRLLYRSPVVSDSEPISTSDDDGEKFIDLEFTVTSTGRVVDIKIQDANVRNVIKRAVKFAVAKARYRPRLVDGVPVDTEGVRMRQTFTSGDLNSAVVAQETAGRTVVSP